MNQWLNACSSLVVSDCNLESTGAEALPQSARGAGFCAGQDAARRAGSSNEICA